MSLATRSLLDRYSTDTRPIYAARLSTESRLPSHRYRPSTVNQWKSTDTLPIFHRHLIDVLSLADRYIGCHSIELRHIPINMSIITRSTLELFASSHSCTIFIGEKCRLPVERTVQFDSPTEQLFFPYKLKALKNFTIPFFWRKIRTGFSDTSGKCFG